MNALRGKYSIKTYDRHTGEARFIVVVADSPEHAIQAVKDMGAMYSGKPSLMEVLPEKEVDPEPSQSESHQAVSQRQLNAAFVAGQKAKRSSLGGCSGCSIAIVVCLLGSCLIPQMCSTQSVARRRAQQSSQSSLDKNLGNKSLERAEREAVPVDTWSVISRTQKRFTAEETSQVLTTYDLWVPENTTSARMLGIFAELTDQMASNKSLGDLMGGVVVTFLRDGESEPVALYEVTDSQEKLFFGDFAVMNHKMTCPPTRSDQMYPNGDIYFQSTSGESIKAGSIMNVNGDFNLVSAEIVLFPGFQRGEQLARSCMDEALERLQQTHRSSYYLFKFFYSDCWWQVAQGDYRRSDGFKQVLMIRE